MAEEFVLVPAEISSGYDPDHGERLHLAAKPSELSFQRVHDTVAIHQAGHRIDGREYLEGESEISQLRLLLREEKTEAFDLSVRTRRVRWKCHAPPRVAAGSPSGPNIVVDVPVTSSAMLPTGIQMTAQWPTEEVSGLVEMLWLERHLLEFLLFKLVEAKLILVADEARFVTQALAEVETVVDRLRKTEALRARAVLGLAEAADVDASKLSLNYLAENSPDPLRFEFEEHRDGFLRLAGEIEEVTVENRRLASRAVQDLSDTLSVLIGGGGGGAAYTRSGSVRSVATAMPYRLDEVL